MPRLQTKINSLFNAPEIYFWYITETESELITLLPPSKGYAKEVTKFKSPSRRKEWLATRVLLHHILGPDAKIDYFSTRRPYLCFSDKEISISHSHKYVALSLSQNPHGIDIEAYGSKALTLRSKFLNIKEASFLESDDPQKVATMLWSAKESVYKLYDIPGLNFSKDILLSPKSSSTLHVELPCIQQTCELHYSFEEHFVITYALVES